MKIFNKKLFYYVSSFLISSFNGMIIKIVIGYEVNKGDYVEYFLSVIIFGYLLTAIISGGTYVSSSLIMENSDFKIKENEARLIFYSSITSSCIIILFYLIRDAYGINT